ncbi:MAG: hypothetical protein NUV77_06855 [Thermoguttaceae bacterium]|jgi:hypothetical protein|nr:hypothetical protein [Thermoguttaceae bacterium]
MTARTATAILLATTVLAAADLVAAESAGYKALKLPPPTPGSTWAILDRDGANRKVEPYLSSLGGGEPGTGAIRSPAFRVAADTIRLTVCGHDGQGGGRNQNYVALVDAGSGEVLRRAAAPGADPMQEVSWDVAGLRGREVRIEVHDGDSGTAFAWIGVGRIDAGAAFQVDFRKGMPAGWVAKSSPAQAPAGEIVPGAIPFFRYPAWYTLIPASGAIELACGFEARRLFFLGCTVPEGKPLAVYGHIDVVYRDGSRESYPLLYGFTLDQAGKLLSRSKAMHLGPSSDPFQHVLVLAPRPKTIEKIVLRRNPEFEVTPRITAVTCETEAAGEHLMPLPAAELQADQAAWIESHAISAGSPDLARIAAEIRRAHKLPEASKQP